MKKKIKSITSAKKHLELFAVPKGCKVAYVCEDGFLFWESEQAAKVHANGRELFTIKI